MPTYAGFQKYDTPNIGKDTADMLILKQQTDAKNAEQAKNDAYKNIELGIKMQKEQRDALSNVNTALDKSQNDLRVNLETIKPLGFATTHSALTDWTTNTVGANSEDRRAVEKGEMNINDYNQDFQARMGEVDKMAKVGEVLNTAATEMGKAKDPNVFSQWVFQKYARAGSPSNDEPTSYKTQKVRTGVMQTTINTYQKDENGNLIPLISAPLDKIYEITHVTNWESPNYDAEAAKDATSIKIDVIETPTPNGGTKKDYNPLSSPKFISARERWVNSILSNESQSPDFYKKHVNPHADFILSTAPESEKKQMAALQGYPDDISKADIITASQNENGNITADFTKEQKAKTKAKLEEIYNSKVARNVVISSPHNTTVNNKFVTVKDDKIGMMYEKATNKALAGDLSGVDYFVTMGKVAGIINPDKMVTIGDTNPDGTPTLDKDGNQTSKQYKTFDFNNKTKVATIWVNITGNKHADPQRIDIDFKDKDEAILKLGQISDAVKAAATNKAMEASYNKVPSGQK